MLEHLPSRFLKKFSNFCLTDKFEDSGIALQDISNQIGRRLGYTVTNGLYRGKQTEVGFDGIWNSKDGYNIVVEVKTTDAYRINLDTLTQYREKLIDQGKIEKEKSSILIIVGRQDTGDLEAQIRGSRHAWDIRLISTDSLLELLELKETLNDTKTSQQINELLKPREYTRVDKLIELIFITTKDLQSDEVVENEVEIEDTPDSKQKSEKSTPVSFHEESIFKIEEKLKTKLLKTSRIAYTNQDSSVGLICAISKAHKQGKNEKFWFAFHPYHRDYLKEFKNAFVAYGCGSADETFLIPFNEFDSWVNNFWTTTVDERMYWHVVIHHKQGRFLLQQPNKGDESFIDISKYRV